MKFFDIKLEHGKYRVIFDSYSGFRALRYGEPWRDLTGDNLIMTMAFRIEELENKLKEISNNLDSDDL